MEAGGLIELQRWACTCISTVHVYCIPASKIAQWTRRPLQEVVMALMNPLNELVHGEHYIISTDDVCIDNGGLVHRWENVGGYILTVNGAMYVLHIIHLPPSMTCRSPGVRLTMYYAL
jgi:hypothetical protein